MSRIRTIKPEFFKSVTLASVSRDARLLFVGLWTYADDSGRGVDEARLIKGELFPLDDDLTPAVVDRLLVDLARIAVIQRYEVAGRRYLVVSNFHEHQKIDRAKPSRLPAAPMERRVAPPLKEQETTPPDGTDEDSTTDRRAVDDGSTTDRRGKGKEGNRERIPVGTAGAVDAAVETTVSTGGASADPAPPFANWASAFGDAWKRTRGGASPQLYGRIGRTLAKLVEEHGQEVVWPAWLRFLASDKAQYGPEQFVDHYRTFTGAAAAGRVVGTVPVAAPADDPLTPTALRARFVEFDLNRPIGDRPAYAAKVDRACPTGMDAGAWRELVRQLHPWDLGQITFAPEVDRTIAQRLADTGQAVAA